MGYYHRSLSLLVVLGACSGNAGQPDYVRPDANLECLVTPTLVLGRCVLEDSTEECSGVPEEVPHFAPLTKGEGMAPVLGPQGSYMFVFAVQTSGIEVGQDTSDRPEVRITLLREGERVMALYRGRPAFFQEPGDPTLLTAAGLFVIVDVRADDFNGMALTAEATILDRSGTFRCGALDFVGNRDSGASSSGFSGGGASIVR